MSLSKKKIIVVAVAGALAAVSAAPLWAAEELSDADTVVVTATMRNHTIASAPAFTTVVTAEDIAKAPVNSLGDLLRETVGVSDATDTTGRDYIQIRGLDAKYTLMLVNGKRVSSGGALWRGGDFDFNSIPLSSIKRVEIVRGPMAALYGSDAIGGVINIITYAPTKDWHGSVTAEYRNVASGEDGQQYRLAAALTGAINDDFSLSVSGEASDRDAWYSTAKSDTTRPPRLEEKQTRNLVSTLGWKLSDTQNLDFDFGYSKDKRPLGLYSYVYYPAWDYTSRAYRAQEITRNTYGVTHKGAWSWGTTTAYLSREDARIDDYNSSYNTPQQRHLKEENTYAKAYANLDVAGNAITTGVDLRRQLIKDPETYLQTGRVQTDNSAVFLEDEIGLSKQINLTLAGRVDHSNKFGNHFTPKTYLSYQVDSEWTVKGGINRAFKAPEAYQLAKEYSVISCGGSCYLSGNPDLTPETSTNYEIGTEFHRKGFNATAVLFKNNVKDMITAVYDASVPSRRWVNVAKARTQGFELQADKELNSAWSVSANFTRTHADATDASGAETKLENRPEQQANASVNWKASDWVQSSLSAHYTGKQYYDGYDLPGYTRYDLGFTVRPNKRVTVRAGVKNLSDVNLEQKNANFNTFELGRNYYLSAAYNF